MRNNGENVADVMCVGQEWKEEVEKLTKQLKDVQGAREEDLVKIAEFDVSTEAVCMCSACNFFLNRFLSFTKKYNILPSTFVKFAREVKIT